MNTEIQTRLEKLALKRSIPFCYSDYIECPNKVCPRCGSDDLMLSYRQHWVEYGSSWIIEAIISEELTAVDTESAFEESVREIYSDTVKVLWLELDAVSVAKEMDPVSWRLAQSEWIDQETSEDNLLTFDNGETYFWTHDVERLLDESEETSDCA